MTFILFTSQGRKILFTDAPSEVNATIRIIQGTSDDVDLPIISSAAAFSPAWWHWWLSCQPAWRIDGNARPGAVPKLNRNVSPTRNLSQLCCGGSEGLMAVVLGLAIWANATEHSQQSNKALSSAVADVLWVLKSLIGGDSHSLSTSTSTKKATFENGGEPAKKK